MFRIGKSIITVLIGTFFIATAISEAQQVVPVLYPKDNALVGNKVNVVLDPTAVPFFQVTVGKTEYPVVDTSTGAHALQGVELQPGDNTITVKVLDRPGDKTAGKDIKNYKVLAWRAIRVFNADGAFPPIPGGFRRDPFHTRDREATCSSCHELEAKEQDFSHEKPENVLCYTCHRQIPQGKNIHGPAAVWNCLACHDPNLYPAKYSFSSADPWKASKTREAVEPAVFTLAAAELFKSASAVLISKAKAKEALRDIVAHCRDNPSEKIRLEVHSDNAPLKKQKTKKGKVIGFRDNKALTVARAKALAAFLKESGISPNKIAAVGMGDTLPKAPNKTKEGRELNNRAEIVVYPSDVKIVNSRKLPLLKDRERVLVTLTYDQGPAVRNVRIVEKMPKGMHYIKESGKLNGKAIVPKANGDTLIWELSGRDSNFEENLFYLVKKSGTGAAVSDSVSILYSSEGKEHSWTFDPKAPKKGSFTVKDACLKCHEAVLKGRFKHGPAEVGYCTLCHDPHASPNPGWIRKPTWDLCTTCHRDKGSGVHVLVGFTNGTHPTGNVPDPVRPGRNLTCSSCHNPHSAESRQLIAFDVRNLSELCNVCHKK